MIVKDIIDECFQDYKKPSMYIAMPYCNWKCCKDCGASTEMCQNSPLATQPNIEIDCVSLVERYVNNDITKAIIFSGLEPIDSLGEITQFLYYLRNIWYCKDDVIIYSGYTEEELGWLFPELSQFGNIIIKVGRFIPNQQSKYDDILGITLASENQYAIRL